MKKYIVYSKNLSNTFEDSIDEQTYNELSQSKEILFEAHSKENMYNIILMNYYEFEQELFQILLKNEIFNFTYSSLNDAYSKIEQRILNLFSSITLYLDSFKFEKNIDKFSNHLADEFKNISDYIEKEKENNIEIKLMKFLRNHIQHNGLLIENISLNGRNLTQELREETLIFHINKKNIKAKWFQVDKFSKLEDKIDLKKVVRGYMDFISNIHNFFREVTDKKTLISRQKFEKIIKTYDDYKCLFVAKSVGDSKIDEITILLDWDDIRVQLVNKNRVPKYFKRHSINTK